MPLVDLKKVVPGYADAVERQDLVRDVAFLGLPERVCGVTVSPLTIRQLSWLQLIRSPFIGCGVALPQTATPREKTKRLTLDIAAFFKAIAPGRPNFMLVEPDQSLAKYLHAVGKLKLPAAVAGIREYVDEAFMDFPGHKESSQESFYSLGAALAHRLAHHYPGLDPNPMNYPSAVDLPLKAAFQLLKLIKQQQACEAGKPAMLFNGLSDRAKTRWMNEQNKGDN